MISHFLLCSGYVPCREIQAIRSDDIADDSIRHSSAMYIPFPATMDVGITARFVDFQCTYLSNTPVDISSIIVTCIFTAEAVMKLIAYGIRGYFKQNWNKFDFIVVVISWIG